MSDRYYEDINVDDELEAIEKLPTPELAAEFFGDQPRNTAFSSAEQGRRAGFEGALVPGLLKLSWLTQYVNNWAGPSGHLHAIRVTYRRPDTAGNPLVLSGRVVDKRQEEGKNIVDLEVVTLAEGQPSVRANATVELPSRAG